MEKLKIWIPFKIWNETQWFSDLNPLIERHIKERKKKVVNTFWKNKGKKINKDRVK